MEISKKSGTGKARVQKFGGFLAGMVMPNIGAFIAWGLITALFIPTGWIPNENFNKLVSPMITYLLPVLIGYTGGKMVYGTRGGVVGAIATMGVIVGSSVTQFLGAMVIGPLGGYLIKKFDELVKDRIPTGFEMLVNTFSSGILGLILALAGFSIIGPVVAAVTVALGNGAKWITEVKLLPLIAILVEPGKILFLNNAINHGIFDPLGIAQVKDVGKSIFFLLESNPGPGLGVLLAYCIYGKGNAKQSAPGAIIIQFLGGIHEIYFPFVMMTPLLLLAVIGGGMAADFTFLVTGAGLVASPAPGSIFAEIAMSPKGGLLPVLAGILVGAVVSFLISCPIIKTSSTDDDESFDSAKDLVGQMKAESKGKTAVAEVSNTNELPGLIVFACDAGMGSSAMGESILKKKVKDAGLKIEVKHSPVNEIPKDADVVFTQESLEDRARMIVPDARIITIKNFLDNKVYDEYIRSLKR
ncbi:MAG: PTS mannitol transporter subunit IICB [Clostridium sp.]|jgi:PTS system mannitol-specific IIC component|uniref:PTS mannitol transporter subunit IICB n=1 Tax=Clostridium sp. TaxID=1506 RepID=UPI0025B8A512|nr:PTS mannitol transporter subunit IICB [Clostridium sp.]MCH3964835.1 PTS mannitol transporter subunit IICB [Clostridium sp.]MCI1717383.1 PTS mannitol transporter subunit IICB [Clostridium sp.]MCI1801723.1 PTS mannitol transporter subunit IICB [Clostridium sp.]MCI1814847.1 PTS mannitol transporter subunit IICB [Clostridium sp.]MCI1872477.1 PTS mannitol transporter subunit IICB [Clostridium sp.]